MSTHTLSATQFVPLPLDEVFEFFGRPENLARITPPAMGFELVTGDTTMREGLRLGYRVKPLAGVPVRWVSEITRYERPRMFVDVQRTGPYASWEHTHTFAAESRGGVNGTLVTDEVRYELPFGPLGDLVHGVVVRARLEEIFRYRREAIEALLPVRTAQEAPIRVAVAGGSGFVGGAIASELYRRGEDVVVLSHRAAGRVASLPDGIRVRRADIASPATLAGALEGAEALVISLAFPNSPMEAPRRGHTFMEVDAAGTERLVAAAKAAGVGRIVYLSGAGAAPDAPRVWFRAKARAEAAVRASGIPFTIIRPTWIYGPRDVSLNRFLGFARMLPFVPLTSFGRQRLAPVFVGDVAALAADSLRSDAARDQVFELGGPETLTMSEVIKVALRVAGLRRPLLPAPPALLKLVALPLQFLPRPPLTPSAVDFINQPATVDTAPLLARMPRRLTPLAEGLATYLAPATGVAGPASPAVVR